MTAKTSHYECFEFHAGVALRQLHSMPCWPDEFKVFLHELDVLTNNKEHQKALRRIDELAKKYGFLIKSYKDLYHRKYIFHFNKVEPT